LLCKWCGKVCELDRLYAWDVDAGGLADLREKLRQRADYPAAAKRLAANMLQDAAGDPALGDMLRDAGRTVAALSAAYLHASGGLTLNRLKAFIAGFGLVSPGRARALLHLMLHLGYVRPDPDTRPQAYSLTPRFLASYARHEASLLDAAALVEPAVRLVQHNLGSPAVMNALVAEQGAAFVAGSGQTRGHEDWYRTFMHRLAGIQMLHGLVADAESFPPTGRIAFSSRETARRFQVSRVHVGRMLRAAVRHGFLELEPGAVQFTDAGRQALDWLYSSRLCVHLASAARTLKAHPELAQPKASAGAVA
jgi:DNA-binding IclR family transcriptional regulator